MPVRSLNKQKLIIALDNTRVREILNPEHDSQPLFLNYSLAHAMLKPGEKSLPHRFHKASEVYYILKGRGIMHIDDEIEEVIPGDTIHIPPKAVQWIESRGSEDLEFLCIVDPAWKPDAEELV
ncbi:MAG: cupin domain-containing protein [Candidatus Thorarchaeota archaeon]|nr:cupin domain-containing protein [Candidatus Thorarchaeota archaeon]